MAHTMSNLYKFSGPKVCTANWQQSGGCSVASQGSWPLVGTEVINTTCAKHITNCWQELQLSLASSSTNSTAKGWQAKCTMSHVPVVSWKPIQRGCSHTGQHCVQLLACRFTFHGHQTICSCNISAVAETCDCKLVCCCAWLGKAVVGLGVNKSQCTGQHADR
jgi:hypothetical protein